MSLTITHAIVPLAAFVAFGPRPLPTKLMGVAMVAAMVPDLDFLMGPLFGVTRESIYSHRGFSHSLFFAIGFGAFAAAWYRQLGVRPLTAFVVCATAMASHGVVDMMTDSGKPVAYLWPLTSSRMFADWRPLPGSSLQQLSFLEEVTSRIGPETVRVIVPLLLAAFIVWGCRAAGTKAVERWWSHDKTIASI